MPFQVGVPELIVIFMILLLVFGASRLPALGESMGRAIRGFKRGIASDDAIQVSARDGGKVAPGAGAKPATEVTDADLVEKS